MIDKKVLDLIEGDNTIWEQHTLPKIAKKNELMCYKHEGFWHPMDTLRDKNYLNKICRNRKFIWKK